MIIYKNELCVTDSIVKNPAENGMSLLKQAVIKKQINILLRLMELL
jgi:hypothetical protein